MNIFVTGIGNNSGKTIISAGIAAVLQSVGYKVGVYKPVQIGAIDKETYLLSPDLALVKMLDQNITTHSTFMMKSKSMRYSIIRILSETNAKLLPASKTAEFFRKYAVNTVLFTVI